MNRIFRPKQLTPYEADYARWCAEQGALLREGRLDAIDRENLAEEIESLGRSDKREIENRLKTLLLHLLKWHFQPGKRKGDWRATIREQRRQIGKLIKESPSLRKHPENELTAEYRAARESAIDETRLEADVFPRACPYGIDEVLDEGFFPGELWTHKPSKRT